MTNAEDDQLVALLDQLTWPVAPKVFAALCRNFTTAVVDLLPVRKNPTTEGYEYLLLRRPADDPFYPGQLHVPGSLFRGHELIESVIERIRTSELAGAVLTPPVLIAGNYYKTAVRGQDVGLVHAAFIVGDYAGEGEWFSFETLPDNMIEQHRVIPGQVREWLKWSST